MIETHGGFLIGQIKQIQGRVFDKLLQKAGIEEFNGAQGRILYVLWQQDNLAIIELSQRTGLAKTTLTSMLDRMEKQGFLLRKIDPKDRRQFRILLTEKARKLNEKYNQVSNQMSELFYKGFDDQEIIQFEERLQLILKNLKEEEKKNQ